MKEHKLLTRTEFREGCLKRDNFVCVICGTTNDLSVHHIIERRLFDNGGYFLQNGATLCEIHHIDAESTKLSCSEIREAAQIDCILLPDDYYADHEYTKWGDVVLPNGNRMKGPLFFDESVQKILKQGPYFDRYVDYIKYPRSWHCCWSEGKTKDDKTLKDMSQFEGREVVVTEKMDGENTSIYKDYIHARSIDGRDHWSRSWVKNLQGKIGYEIPEGWRICAENLYAKHSIKYNNLKSYIYVFSLWDDTNFCLKWDDTVEYASILGLETVPVLYRGIYDEKAIKALYDDSKRETMEGYVIRLADGFKYLDFNKSLAKFVRANHVSEDNHHWMFTATEKNELQ